MHCPACSSELETKMVNDLSLDICQKGCGGIWFNQGELEKIDHDSETLPGNILRPVKYQNVVIDKGKQRNCPKCSSHPLDKNISDENNIEIDSCFNCGGIWLDLGEIEKLREENSSKDMRADIITSFIKKAQSSDPASKKRINAVIQLLFK